MMSASKPRDIFKSIAILATGDEIVSGDVFNSNGPAIAQILFQHNINVSEHLMLSDDQPALVRGIQDLLKRHQIVITIGGLGPTSDDRTRFALSEALNLPLVFNEESWARIVRRLSAINLTPVESNRQQALFPNDASIIPNENGSADACDIVFGNQRIFMLPGPPIECLTIFNERILPILLQLDLQSPIYRKHWLLMNVSEGNLAQEIDTFIHSDIQIGYRFAYPYIELKLASQNLATLNEVIKPIRKIIAPHIISENNQTAAAQFHLALQTFQGIIAIHDTATGGRLEATIHFPDTHHQLIFYHNKNAPPPDAAIHVQVSGLEAYWEGQTSGETALHLTINETNHTFPIRISGDRALRYVTETVCYHLYRQLMGLSQHQP